jgi:quinone-modifying oxidoreductase subunit QmoA
MAENGGRILVAGGGVAGMTVALEAAEAGCEVVLVEKSTHLGGRVARMHQYFPKLCPPACGLEINFRRIKNNPSITVLTLAEVEALSGQPGAYEATIRISPRYVKEDCTLCGACAAVCPSERPDEFNYGLAKTRAVYLPHSMAFPTLYAIDRSRCKEGCRACVDACRYGAIDIDSKAISRTFKVAAVVAATGWAPYDAAKIDNLGFGRYRNVVSNVIMERLAAADGPTGGRIVRPSDGGEPKSVAFVQCAGSRDDNHLPYCSAVCCSASLKQAAYVLASYPDARITIFYIDVRTPGRLEDFLAKVTAGGRVELVRGKVAKVEEDPASGDLVVTAEDVLAGVRASRTVNLLVLATGMVPQTSALPPGFALDEFRFISQASQAGLHAAGCVRRPEEVSAAVQDATGAALKAFQCAARSACHG